jgi:hypothetical protein
MNVASSLRSYYPLWPGRLRHEYEAFVKLYSQGGEHSREVAALLRVLLLSAPFCALH